MGAVALIGQHSADGYGGVDIIDSSASEASAEYAGGGTAFPALRGGAGAGGELVLLGQVRGVS